MKEEVLEHRRAVLGVAHLWVKLKRVDPTLGILEGGDRARVGTSDHSEARGRLRDRVAVVHPYCLALLEPGKERRVRNDPDDRAPVFAPLRNHLAAERMRDPLHPVAEAED